MRIIESIEEMREYSQQCKHDGKTIASVDTDAYLHDGHMSLVVIAKENADVVVLNAGHSVSYKETTKEEYNEAVFNYKNDTFLKDLELAKSYGVDVYFYPAMKELYVDELSIPIEMVDKVYDSMRNRDAFQSEDSYMFNYVLGTYFPIFNVVTPDISVVGQKDAYQSFGVKFLIKQLDLPIEVIMAPIIRDSDGLACSSRNDFLTSSQRQNATSIYQTLHEISKWSTYPSVTEIKEHITNRINQANGDIAHIDICCVETLKELNSINKKFIIIVNAKFGDVNYLIDNIIIDPERIKR